MSVRKSYLTILMALVGFNIFQTVFHREASDGKECGSWVRPVVEADYSSDSDDPKIGWFLDSNNPVCPLQMSGRFSELILSSFVLGAIVLSISLTDDNHDKSQLARFVKENSQRLLQKIKESQRYRSDKTSNTPLTQSDFEYRRPAPMETVDVRTTSPTDAPSFTTKAVDESHKVQSLHDGEQIRATPGDKSVVLQWEGRTTNYFVYVSNDNFQTQNHFSCFGNMTIIKNLTNGKTYWFRIRQYETDSQPTGLTYPVVSATPNASV
jgi:hypothetical protein